MNNDAMQVITNAKIEDLKMRNRLVGSVMGMLHGDDDPQVPDCLEELRRQQREIQSRLVAEIAAERARRGLPEPEPVVIGLKPLRVMAHMKNPT